MQMDAVQSYIARTFETSAVKPLTEEELRGSIESGVVWFKNAQEENGHFRYEYLPYEGTYRNDDNVVRQAGGLYALGEILRKSESDTLDLSRTIEKSIGYFETLSRLDERTGARCIVRSATSVRCPLGATSLALIGILGYVEHAPEKARQYDSLITDYHRHILTMQKEGGGFRDVHSVGSAKSLDTESSFSNGEALLALVRMYRHDPSEETKRAIDRAFAYLSAQPFDANLYLWIMAATKEMYALWPSDTYLTYAEKFTSWRLERGALQSGSKRNYCAYAEGLASAASILEGEKSEGVHARLRKELDRLNRNHLALQIGARDTYRVITPGGVLRIAELKEPARAMGGFLTEDSEPTERIDFTQHCIVGYLQTLVDIERAPL
jgi:hypothetical protein